MGTLVVLKIKTVTGFLIENSVAFLDTNPIKSVLLNFFLNYWWLFDLARHFHKISRFGELLGKGAEKLTGELRWRVEENNTNDSRGTFPIFFLRLFIQKATRETREIFVVKENWGTNMGQVVKMRYPVAISNEIHFLLRFCKKFTLALEEV